MPDTSAVASVPLPTVAPGVRVEALDAGRLVALREGPLCSLQRLRHGVHAHRLAGAESFTELRSRARLVGVERHGYQLETVPRVLRTLRGRALQSDEVGLGKTLEALMVLLEFATPAAFRKRFVDPANPAAELTFFLFLAARPAGRPPPAPRFAPR